MAAATWWYEIERSILARRMKLKPLLKILLALKSHQKPTWVAAGGYLKKVCLWPVISNLVKEKEMISILIQQVGISDLQFSWQSSNFFLKRPSTRGYKFVYTSVSICLLNLWGNLNTKRLNQCRKLSTIFHKFSWFF